MDVVVAYFFIVGSMFMCAGFVALWLENTSVYKRALRRIAKGGVHGSAWCVAVAEQTLSGELASRPSAEEAGQP